MSNYLLKTSENRTESFVITELFKTGLIITKDPFIAHNKSRNDGDTYHHSKSAKRPAFHFTQFIL